MSGCDLALGSAISSNGEDIIFGQFRVRERYALGLPVLRDLVGIIVSVSAEEQVRIVHARSVVTLVASEKPVRDRTMLQLPCDAVSGLRCTTDPDLTITGYFMDRTSPEMAACLDDRMDRTVAVDLGLEALDERWSLVNASGHTGEIITW